MSEELFFLLSIPFAAAMGAILIKFVLLCHQAREEEFAARLEAVARARSNRS